MELMSGRILQWMGICMVWNSILTPADNHNILENMEAPKLKLENPRSAWLALKEELELLLMLLVSYLLRQIDEISQKYESNLFPKFKTEITCKNKMKTSDSNSNDQAWLDAD